MQWQLMVYQAAHECAAFIDKTSHPFVFFVMKNQVYFPRK
jgi:hypothetical protein